MDWYGNLPAIQQISLALSVLSAVVAVGALLLNRSMASANKTMAEAAMSSLAHAEEANELAQRSLEDQIEANRASRAASIAIIEPEFIAPTEEQRKPHWDPIAGMVSEDGLAGFLRFDVFNEGAASAFRVRVTGRDLESRQHTMLMSWKDDDPDSHFASYPYQPFSHLLPIDTKTCKFAIRDRPIAQGLRDPLTIGFVVRYSDSLGEHDRCFDVTIHPGSISGQFWATAFECARGDGPATYPKYRT